MLPILRVKSKVLSMVHRPSLCVPRPVTSLPLLLSPTCCAGHAGLLKALRAEALTLSLHFAFTTPSASNTLPEITVWLASLLPSKRDLWPSSLLKFYYHHNHHHSLLPHSTYSWEGQVSWKVQHLGWVLKGGTVTGSRNKIRQTAGSQQKLSSNSYLRV